MSASETNQLPAVSSPEITLTTPSDRRLDIDTKQLKVADLVQKVGCEGLLVLDPANFAWLTSGAIPRGVVDAAALPVLYVSPEGRWLLCANVDTQRLFDEELDGLGFQLKEWPWHWGREQLLADLCGNRKVACDQPYRDCELVADQLQAIRCRLTAYEQACYRALGQIVGHALEATCRTINPGETEREAAGQISHRLVHRGVHPLSVTVMADGRSQLYRQGGYTPTPLQVCAVMSVVAQKYGLTATASRSMMFSPGSSTFQREHDAACRVSATYVASSWPDAVPRQVIQTARRVYQVTGAEHEWLLCPQGHITGRLPVELLVMPESEQLFQANWAITWRASVGSGLSCDTFLITEDGPRTLTTSEGWPLKKIKVQGAEFLRPDVLIRE